MPIGQAQALLKGPGHKRPMDLFEENESPAVVSRKRVKTAAQPNIRDIPKKKAVKKRVESSSDEFSVQEDE